MIPAPFLLVKQEVIVLSLPYSTELHNIGKILLPYPLLFVSDLLLFDCGLPTSVALPFVSPSPGVVRCGAVRYNAV